MENGRKTLETEEDVVEVIDELEFLYLQRGKRAGVQAVVWTGRHMRGNLHGLVIRAIIDEPRTGRVTWASEGLVTK